MTLHQHDCPVPLRDAHVIEALDYDGSFVVEKLCKDRIVDSIEEGEGLFDEVKKFLVLVASDAGVPWEMYSTRVDEAWHQFILFTAEYMAFCQRFFGKYMPHSPHRPATAGTSAAPSVPLMSFTDFARRYEDLYGTALPDVWRDHKNITVSRRMFSDRVGRLTLRDDGDMVDLLDEAELLLSVNQFAREALDFVARTGVFYVRELPVGLTDEEQVALATALAESGALRVGA